MATPRVRRTCGAVEIRRAPLPQAAHAVEVSVDSVCGRGCLDGGSCYASGVIAPPLPAAPAELPPPDASLIVSVQQFLDHGRPLDGWQAVRGLRPLREWWKDGAEAAHCASRLISWLGNHRLSDATDWLSRPRYPEHGGVFIQWLSALQRRRGLHAMLRAMRDRSAHPPLTPVQQVRLLGSEAEILGGFRDFREAHRLLDEAARIIPASWRVHSARASVLEDEDDRPAALEQAREAARLNPGSVNTPQLIHRLLVALGRPEEALAVLREAEARLQDFDLSLALTNWHSEHEDYAAALAGMDRCELLQPLATPRLKRWMNGRRAFWHYLRGDDAEALRCADLAPESFVAKVAERLRSGAAGRRVRLPVPFVRQHHVTCAPATLAAISAFFGHPVEHVEVAETICYDGTPDHSERRWATERGWTVREFRITLETARALLDRGIPFTLTTVEPTSAHLQAVIGYDARAGTILVREPGRQHFEEYTEKWLEDYAFSGPRGMVLLPPDKAALLDGVELPEAELYDRLHRLRSALHFHRRDEAAAELEELLCLAPGHRLTWMAQRIFAAEDCHHPLQLAAVDGLLEQYPDSRALLYGRLCLLRETEGRAGQLSFARRVIAAGKAPGAVRVRLASLLDEDAREWPAAEREWRRVLRQWPYWTESLRGMANCLWHRQHRTEALGFYRLWAAQDAFDEDAAGAYFRASRALGDPAPALTFLRERAARHARKSSAPAITLASVLESMKRDHESLAVVEAALQSRPDDGALLLDLSARCLTAGMEERAEKYLARAESLTPARQWLRRAAEGALRRARPEEAIAFYRRVLELEPLASDVHSALAGLLNDTDSREAAVQHYEQVCAQHPGHYDILTGLVRWLAPDRVRRAPVLRRLLELNPANGWAARELVEDLSADRNFAEAAVILHEAIKAKPNEECNHGFLGELLMEQGRTDEALEAFRAALRLNADYTWALERLVECSRTREEKKAALAFAAAEMERQVIKGDGLATWRLQALAVLEPEEVRSHLEQAHRSRPDLWWTWSCLLHHSLDEGRVDDAWRFAEEQAQNFPLMARAWLDLATVHAAREDTSAERAALARTLELNPSWGQAVRKMAAACERDGDSEAALAVLERQARGEPSDTTSMSALFHLLRRMERKADAFQWARKAVSASPFHWEAWKELGLSVAECLDLPDPPADLDAAAAAAAALTEKHPANYQAWECRAWFLEGRGELQAQLAVLREGAASLPHSWDLRDRLASLLAENSLTAEALACCTTDGVPEDEYKYRQARAAWVLYTSGDHAEGIRRMEAVSEASPGYGWSINRLLEWHQTAGHWLAVERWASALLRADPRDAYACGYRAEALIEMDRALEAEADLRAALMLEPGYQWAGRELIKLLLARRDLEGAQRTVTRIKGRQPLHELARRFEDAGYPDEALAMCRQAVAEDSGKWVRHTALGAMLSRRGDLAAAFEALQQGAYLAPTEESPWKQWYDCAKTAGRIPEMRAAVLTWCREKPGDVWRWLSLYDLARWEQERIADILSIFDEALASLPHSDRLLDLKAVQLANQSRFTEALAVCATPGLPPDAASVMQRRAAWIYARRGELPEAIRLMAEALKAEPGHAFGLESICEWLSDEKRYPELDTWARRLIEARPRHHMSFGWLAYSFVMRGEKAEALPHLRRALSEKKTYEWAGDQLFDILMERQDLAEAASALAFLTRHQPGAGTVVKKVRLAAARGEKEAAFAAFAELKNAEAGQRIAAESALDQAGWQREVTAAWHERAAPGANQNAAGGNFAGTSTGFADGVMDPDEAAHWMRRICAAGGSKAWQDLALKHWPENVLIAAWEVWIEAASNKGWTGELHRAVKEKEGLFRRNTDLWAAVLRAFSDADNKAAIQWGSDWKERPDLRPWMTANYGSALHRVRGPRATLEVRRYSVDHLPSDHGTAIHRAWLALISAADGRMAEATSHLENLRDPDLNFSGHPAAHRLLVRLARILLALADETTPLRDRRRQATTDIRAALQSVPDFRSNSCARAGFRLFHLAAWRPLGVSGAGWTCLAAWL
jgi:tetratricopeptide (TPR) repeat protein